LYGRFSVGVCVVCDGRCETKPKERIRRAIEMRRLRCVIVLSGGAMVADQSASNKMRGFASFLSSSESMMARKFPFAGGLKV
jgi:hypothetical protein